MWFMLVACSSSDPHAEPALPRIEEKASDPVRAEHMKEHFDDATIGMEAWLSGELPTATQHLTWLGEHNAPEGLVAGTQEDLDAMQGAARRAAGGGPPEQVAKELTAVALACGDCHRHSGAKPVLKVPPVPPPSKQVTAHMTGHLWAVNTMWAGLVTNDEDLWKRGATALDTEPAHGFEDEQQTLAVLIHDAGRAALKATTREERAEAFATIIGTCARCHLDTRGE